MLFIIKKASVIYTQIEGDGDLREPSALNVKVKRFNLDTIALVQRREPTARAAVGGPPDGRSRPRASSLFRPPRHQRVACSSFAGFAAGPITISFRRPASRRAAAASRLKLWLLAAAMMQSCHVNLRKLLAKAISLQCSASTVPGVITPLPVRATLSANLDAAPSERSMAGTRQRQHLRDVSQALYWVPRHDDGSAVTAAFLPALGYEISERYVFFAREAASCSDAAL